MLGTFQQSALRIELAATALDIRACLLEPRQFRRWLWPQQFSDGLPDVLQPGLAFSSQLGPVQIQHQVTDCTPQRLRLVMAGSIDGFHEWSWGEGWVQSRLEGISPLPLNLAQTTNLWRLRHFLATTLE
ncbi:hypothetical protein [Leptolyngbya sp. PCC 6406]|uniref:hypothetical protein n=1 Tax=Leptolyngbya sp. PCC 6406 TaxID=1173264 RepID=UPI0002AC7DAC|nr:hypothetical protein [Leptolyngbya sp. PCC 6406]